MSDVSDDENFSISSPNQYEIFPREEIATEENIADGLAENFHEASGGKESFKRIVDAVMNSPVARFLTSFVLLPTWILLAIFMPQKHL